MRKSAKRKDKMTPEQRSYCMSRIKSQDTTPERLIRSRLHGLGYRFRKCVKTLPGKPDIVFVRQRTVIFIDGNFSHGYRLSQWKRTLKPFWRKKIEANRLRDLRTHRKLRRLGWKVLRVWEHAIYRDIGLVVDKITRELKLRKERVNS